MYIKDRNYGWFVFLIVLVAAALRFRGIGSIGVQSDAALNAVRALGWLDFLVGAGQTSPIVWFGSIPWWGGLSFHDHPPLVFFLQHVFFWVFGATDFVALLPFGLAGIATAVLVYWLVKKFASPKEALLALLLFALSSYAVWISRSGYLEGIEYIFIFLSVFFFVYFLELSKTRYLIFWSLATGLALLSKYTAVFLLPAAFLYLLLWRRDVFRQKRFWLALLLLPLILSPVILYNYQVFQARGHFDAALSSMLGMHPEDYEVIAARGANANLLRNLWSIAGSLWATASVPFLLLELLAFAYGIVAILRGWGNTVLRMVALNILMIFLMFSFSGSQPRLLAILTPFLSINLALVYFEWQRRFSLASLGAKALGALLVVVLVFELFYAVNTNLVSKPWGKEGIFYSTDRFYDNGFAELDRYLRTTMLPVLPNRRQVKTYDELVSLKIKGDEIVLFDGRADWFATMWHVNRYSFYYDAPIVFIADLSNLGEERGDPFVYLAERGVKNYWFILTTDEGVVGSKGNQEYRDSISNLLQSIQGSGLSPVKEIKNYKGQAVFKIYRFSFSG